MVDSLVLTVVDKLKTVLQDEVTLLVSVTNEITKLSSTFTLIQAVLQDAESRRVKDRAVKIWMDKVKDVAYDVDDILDEWTTEAPRSEASDEGDDSCFSFLLTCFLCPVTCFKHALLRHKIGSGIKKVRGRLDDLEKVKNQLGLRVDSGEGGRMDSEVRVGDIGERETGFLLNRPSIVGREGEKNEILNFLLGESSSEVNEVYSVISIVGMGGLGKTTLAQLAYNDEKVKEHFHMSMWVCVSDNFDVKQITKSSIESATRSGCESLDLATLQDRLRCMLRSKRFLLVLDDVWSNDSGMWDKLIPPFQGGAPGSRIIVTTRREDVAWAMGRARICKPAVLSEDDCWLLFWRRALEHRSAEERSELEVIGKEIVKKCGGLPLAAKTIGSAMCSKRTTTEWDLVLKSDIWSSESSDDAVQRILPALLLSYQDLRPALKQCFAYLSIFPKDRWINKDLIVKLWVAQGFIRSDGSRDDEEIGGQYFDDLLRRSLLQDAKLDDDKNIVHCKMHDLVHDLAQSVAESDCSLVGIGKQASKNLSNVRHSLVSDEGASNWDTLYKAHKLRTLLCYTSISRVVSNNLFHQFRHLRALDLSCTSIQKLPRTVGKLKHLRYLDLSHTMIEELPEGVSNCRNLQTLRLKSCYKLKKLPGTVGKLKHLRYLDLFDTKIEELPEGVSNYRNLQSLILMGCGRLKKLPTGLRKMISLRHLELEYTDQLKYLPQGIGNLSSLRTLTKFIVEGGNEGCKWGELKQLINQLQGSLKIEGMEKVRSTDEAREAELDKNHKLYALSYEYRGGQALEDEEVKRMEEVLEILQPHTNLKEFKIRGYEGSKLPKWIVDPVFSNLVKVGLYSCKKCKQLPGLGKLPSLKYLEIWGMDEVGKVGGEFSGDDNKNGSGGGGGGGGVSFPKLETLSFLDMRNWEEWELRGGDGEVMPSLLQLEIKKCPKLKELPSNLPPLLQELTLKESDVGMSSGGSLPVLPNLNHLKISRNDELTSLPSGWLGQLKALQTLEIRFCKRLGSLPEELQHLTMLQNLDITGCPVLKERYGDGGEDRDKIARIPNISFDWVLLR